MTKDRARQKAAKYLEWAELAEQKAEAILQEFENDPRTKDIAFLTQPAYNNAGGRAFARQRENLFNKKHKAWEYQEKAKRYREKADNLQWFANRNKGDAEAKRELERSDNDLWVTVGLRVNDVVFGTGEVIKINKKTYTIKWDRSGSVFTRDKSFIERINE